VFVLASALIVSALTTVATLAVPSDALLPTTPAPTATARTTPPPTATATQRVQPVAALAQSDMAAIGFTPDDQPFLGDPDAPLVIHEFSDYLCPFCARHFRETLPLLREEYLATGKARLVFHDFPIASLHPTAQIGHQAARCVAEEGAAHFWAMHDALFARQDEWNRLSDPTEFVNGLAEEIGADPVRYAACMASGRTAESVAVEIAAGEALGFNATPSFRIERLADDYTFDLVGAYPVARFREVLEAMLAGDEAPATPTPAPASLPYWADAGLAPDPARPGFTLAGDPYKGSTDALLTIVEFSDFQCPACATHAIEVQPAVDAALIDAGEVRWVFKNFPLRSHPQTFAAAAAAECAGDQGQFWPMHDLLFARQADWGVDAVDDALVALAGELDLDLEAFSACTASRQALERVLPDLYDAQGIVESTPTFIFLDGNAGAVYQGSRDATAFVGLVRRFIETLSKQERTP
jgi:protein-disulfide isomerase